VVTVFMIFPRINWTSWTRTPQPTWQQQPHKQCIRKLSCCAATPNKSQPPESKLISGSSSAGYYCSNERRGSHPQRVKHTSTEEESKYVER